MAGMKGRLLALSWTMPPLVFPRSLQISRLLRALQARGWETAVVTVTPDAEPFATLDHPLEDFYKDAYRRILIELREDELPSPMWLKLWRRLHPPADIRTDNWIRRAGLVMHKEILSGDYGAMITFAQPWVDHTIGLTLKRAFREMPWIAHFSDPWVDSAYRTFTSAAEREDAFRHERDIISAADAIIFVNQHTADLVMEKYPQDWRDKVHIIPHGFESDLLAHLKASEARGQVMRIVHTGNFYGHRRPDHVMRAAKALSEDPAVKASLQLAFVGHADEALRQKAVDFGVGEIVSFSGSRAYLDSLAIAHSADLLLLIDAPAETNVFLPSKIVDYLMLQRPILGITPAHGASAEALQAAGCAVVEPEDYGGILAGLTQAYQHWKRSGQAGPTPSLGGVTDFEIDNVAAKFEQVLHSVSPQLAATAQTQATSLLLSHDGVNALLNRRGGRSPMTLMLWSSDEALGDALLSRTDVTSIILTSHNRELADKYPLRCGWWDAESAQLVLPARLGAEIHCFLPGAQLHFGAKTAYRLWKRKVRFITFHDVSLGTVRSSIGAQMFHLGVASLRYRLNRTAAGQKLDRLLSWRSVNLIEQSIAQRSPCKAAVPGRVMLVTGSLGPGGSERQAVNTLLGLKAAGVTDLSLLHVRPMVPPHDFFYPALREARIPCLQADEHAAYGGSFGELPANYRLMLQAMGRLGVVGLDMVLNYLRVFCERRPEIVHTWLDETNVTAGIAAVLAGVPKVIIGCRSLAPYHFPFHQTYMRPIYQILAAQPNVTILNNSQAGANDYIRWAHLPRDVRVIRNGFHFGQLPPDRAAASRQLKEITGAAENVLLVGTVMRLSAEKRPHLWLDVAEQVAAYRPDAHFVIIGDGPLMQELKHRIESPPLRGRISLLGRRQDATQLLAGLDAFVLTSSVEGLPNVIVEAQAEGVAVVASDVGGVREVFRDGETGILVGGHTAGDFATAVMRVLAEPDLRQRASDLGPRLMRERFSVDRMIRETLQVYGQTN